MSKVCGQPSPGPPGGPGGVDRRCTQPAGHDRHTYGSSSWWHEPTAKPVWHAAVGDAVRVWQAYLTAPTPLDAAAQMLELGDAMGYLASLSSTDKHYNVERGAASL